MSVIALTFAIASGARGEDRLIPFSGVVTGVSGQVRIAATIFDAPNGGRMIWGTEVHPITVGSDGRFSLMIGASLLDFRNQWLETVAQGDGVPDLSQLPAESFPTYLQLELLSGAVRTAIQPRYALHPALVAESAGTALRVKPQGVSSGMFKQGAIGGGAIGGGLFEGRHIALNAITDSHIHDVFGISRIAEGAITDAHIDGRIRRYSVDGDKHFPEGSINVFELGFRLISECQDANQTSQTGFCGSGDGRVCVRSAACPQNWELVSGGCQSGAMEFGSYPAENATGTWSCNLRFASAGEEPRARCCRLRLQDGE